MAFKSYLILAIAVGLLSSVVSLLSHTSFKAETSMALGLLTLALLVTPVFSLLLSGVSFPEPGSLPSAIGGELSEITEDAFTEGIEKYICEEYGVESDEVAVSCFGFLPRELRAERIEVSLSGGGVFIDLSSLERTVEESFTQNGKCEVNLNFGS